MKCNIVYVDHKKSDHGIIKTAKGAHALDFTSELLEEFNTVIGESGPLHEDSSMRIAVHIAFYYVESRLKYLNKVLKNLSGIPHTVKVFVYSNKKVDLHFSSGNVQVQIIQTRFLNSKHKKKPLYSYIPFIPKQYVDPFYLTWKNRKYVKRYIEEFDVQIYLEDDIGFTNKTLEYWLKYKNICLANDYNLGFLRFEVDEDNDRSFYTDLTQIPEGVIRVENQLFLHNDINPYCGFWIYDKNELKKFTESKEWRFKFKGYGIREKSAVGWHGENMKRYKSTVIPVELIKNNTYVIHDDCKVHHFPNSYIGHKVFCSVEFPIQLKITKIEDGIEQFAVK